MHASYDRATLGLRRGRLTRACSWRLISSLRAVLAAVPHAPGRGENPLPSFLTRSAHLATGAHALVQGSLACVTLMPARFFVVAP
jgi:hypothetical protein